MSVTGEVEDVDTYGNDEGEGVTDDEADEKGLAFAVEGDAAYFEDDGFERPSHKDGEDRALYGVEGDDGETDGVEGPPSESILTYGEENHNECAPQHVGNFETIVRDVAHVADGGDHAVEISGAIFEGARRTEIGCPALMAQGDGGCG